MKKIMMLVLFALPILGCDVARVEVKKDAISPSLTVQTTPETFKVEKGSFEAPVTVPITTNMTTATDTVHIPITATVEKGSVPITVPIKGALDVRVGKDAVHGEMTIQKGAFTLQVPPNAVVIRVDTSGLVSAISTGEKEICYVFVAVVLVLGGMGCWLIYRSMKKDWLAADNARIAAENRAIVARQDMEKAISVMPPDKAKEFLGFLGTRP